MFYPGFGAYPYNHLGYGYGACGAFGAYGNPCGAYPFGAYPFGAYPYGGCGFF